MIRSAVTRTVLAHVDGNGAAGAEVRGAVGYPLVSEVETPSWIPIERHLDVMDALSGALAPDAMQRLFRDAYVEGFAELPAVRSLVQAALRVMSPTPGALVHVLPRGWRALSRSLGEFEPGDMREVDDDTRAVELVFRDFPRVMAQRPAWIPSFSGVFDGFLLQVGASGRVRVLEARLDRRQVIYELRWVTSPSPREAEDSLAATKG